MVPSAAHQAARADAFASPLLSFAKSGPELRLLGFSWQGLDGEDVRGTSILGYSSGEPAAELTTWLRPPIAVDDGDLSALDVSALEFVAAHEPSQQHIEPSRHDAFQDQIRRLVQRPARIDIDGAAVAATEVRWDGIRAYAFSLGEVVYTAAALFDVAGPEIRLTATQKYS